MNTNSLVIFFVSQEQSLTGSESDREKGLRVFKSYDQQGKFFFCFYIKCISVLKVQGCHD